jgi:ribosomal protein S21
MFKEDFFKNNGICVYRKKDEDVNNLIKRFKKKVFKSRILKESKERMHFIKPSDLKRRKRSLSKFDVQKNNEMNIQNQNNDK